jgi:hypothetical protein
VVVADAVHIVAVAADTEEVLLDDIVVVHLVDRVVAAIVDDPHLREVDTRAHVVKAEVDTHHAHPLRDVTTETSDKKKSPIWGFFYEVRRLYMLVAHEVGGGSSDLRGSTIPLVVLDVDGVICSVVGITGSGLSK